MLIHCQPLLYGLNETEQWTVFGLCITSVHLCCNMVDAQLVISGTLSYCSSSEQKQDYG